MLSFLFCGGCICKRVYHSSGAQQVEQVFHSLQGGQLCYGTRVEANLGNTLSPELLLVCMFSCRLFWTKASANWLNVIFRVLSLGAFLSYSYLLPHNREMQEKKEDHITQSQSCTRDIGTAREPAISYRHLPAWPVPSPFQSPPLL